MEENTNAIVEQIAQQLTKKNPSYVNIFQKYGLQFSEKIQTRTKNLSIGLFIGLTKHFLEFGLQAVLDLDKNADEKKIDESFSLITDKIAEIISDYIDDEIVVYVIYRKLKQSIDEILKENCEA